MWELLVNLYQESLINQGEPRCLFPETKVFNEGWLLRSVLKVWKTSDQSSQLGFLPLPPDAKVYSEGQLRTPFAARFRGDPLAETHSRVDGIAGHFSIQGTKSGIDLDDGWSYAAIFEAKVFSPLSARTKKATRFGQLSRITACLINNVLQKEPAAAGDMHVVVLHAADNLHFAGKRISRSEVADEILNRLKGYKQAGELSAAVTRFEAGWEAVFERVSLGCHTWEDVLEEIGDGGLHQYYAFCKRFNS
jgi:hypothetical protein